MVIIKKLQQGGSIYADTSKVDYGARNLMDLFKTNTQVPRQSESPFGSRKGQNNTPTTDDKIPEGLQSDIDYYVNKKTEIENKISKLLLDGIDNDEKAEYEQLLKDKYALESVVKPKIKSMYKLFQTSKTKFANSKAGDTPAIIDNNAIVIDKDEKLYKIVPVNELVKNANKYDLLSASQAFSNRMNDYRFSGFTNLGTTADRIINEAYGSSEFLKYINDRIQKLGYTKLGRSKLKLPSSAVISFDDIKFDEFGNISTKTNRENLKALAYDVLGDPNSNAFRYMYNNAADEVYNEVKSGSTKIKSDRELQEKINYKMISNLLRFMKGSLFVDQSKEPNEFDGGLSLADKLKTVKRSVYNIATSKLLTETKELGVAPGIEKESNAGELLYKVNSVEIPKSQMLLDNGYKEATKTNADDDANLNNKRILKNNQLINTLKDGNSYISGADGTPIDKMVDDGDIQYITTPKDSRMYFLIAPMEKTEDGKYVVNFENTYYKNMPGIIKEVFAELSQKITPEEAASGKHIKELQAAVKKIDAKLRKSGGIPDGTKLGVALAFDVIINMDDSYEDYKYSKDASSNEDDYLYAISPNWFERNTKRMTVFAPVGRSFWNIVLSPNVMGPEAEANFNLIDWLQTFKKDYSPDVSEPGQNEFKEFSIKEASKYNYPGAEDVSKILNQ
jgi:hypothetical protein